MPTVLLVEDDASIAQPLTVGLERQGFLVSHVGTGTDALRRAPDHDLVLLDLGLPDVDGYEVCRRLRSTSEIPIIVVTARDSEVDRVVGLEIGADDYVVKPFGIRELAARIRAVLRRVEVRAGARPVDHAAGSAAPSSPEHQEDEWVDRLGALVVDRRTRRVTVDGDEVGLTAKEFDLLAALVQDPGAVVHRQQLLRDVWDQQWFGSTKTLDVHVASLRRKLGDAGWIETVRGVGFRAVRLR